MCVPARPASQFALRLLQGLRTPDTGQQVAVKGVHQCGGRFVVDGPQADHLRRRPGNRKGASQPGELTARRGRFLGMVFQAYYLIPEIDALANVLMGARMVGGVGPAERDRAAALLKRVGLAERGHHLPNQLSGGERQRVAVARALMNQPEVILADEPTGNLDERTGDEVIALLLEVCAEEQTALVLVTHNPLHAKKTNRQLVLKNGQMGHG